MIRADQIPDEVARLADEVYYDTAGANPTMSDENIMKHAIAAALIAWPGVTTTSWYENGVRKAALNIPLPQEPSDV